MDDEYEALEAAQYAQEQQERAQRESAEKAARELKRVIADITESSNRFHTAMAESWKR